MENMVKSIGMECGLMNEVDSIIDEPELMCNSECELCEVYDTVDTAIRNLVERLANEAGE